MGRRRDKVRWSQVDLHQEKTPSVPILGPPQEAYSIQQKPPTDLLGDRSHPHRRHSSSLAPRFAKKPSRPEAINSKEADCSVEELPDGYIKIRSKNLDIIFKKEFYHKRMMELQVRGITPNKVKEEWNDASLSKSSSINIPGNSEDPASVTVAPMSSFNDLDLDEIPEFRPRVGTDGGSINDSGYSSSFQESFCYDKQPQYPPLPGPVFLPPPNLPPPLASQQMCPFYLFSPATNTLIPCEEVLVHKSLDTPGGQVFQSYTKAYVAYPVQGPEGRGYVMQPFSVPPELTSSPEREKIEGGSEVVQEDELDSSYKEVLTKSSTQLKPEERTPKIGHVILPNVYIPGLPPSEMRAKKKRRKKPKAKSDQAPRLPSSSESDAKEFEPVNYPRTPETEELYEFINEELVNEINLTDDLTNSLLNPPTEDEEIESSALAREILNLVETDEDTALVEVAPRVETEELLEEPNLADAAEPEAKGDTKPTKETIINPKPKSTKPQTKQTQKKLKKTPEPKIAHLMDVLLSLQPSTSGPAQVIDQEDQNIVEQGLDPEASSKAFTDEETKPTQNPIPAKINETEVKLEEVEETTATENQGCLVSDFDELCLLEEAEHSPPPNIPAVGSKVRDNKGRRRKKRSSKEVKGEENPSKKVLVMDNQVDDFHNAWVRGYKESVVWIKELGYGMDRGVMELERLFQGHYVPPARGEYVMKEEKEVEPVMIDTLEVE